MRTNVLVLIASIILMAIIHVSGLAYPKEALVVHIPFDEGKGNEAMDQSQNGFRAELERDYEWTQGKKGAAVEFKEGFARIPDDDRLNVPQISVMAWIYPREITPENSGEWWNSNNSIYGKADEVSDDSVVLSLLDEDGIFFYIDTGTDHKLLLPDYGLKTEQWYHIAGTFDGENMRVYIDGELAGEMPVVGSIIANANDSMIGGRAAQEIWFRGIIDEFALFSQALTADEINEMMELSQSIDPAQKLAATWGGIKGK